MSSLGDIQQIHSMLQQISRLLDEVDTKTDDVTKKTVTLGENFRQFEQILLRSLILTRRMGIDDDLSNAAMQIQRMIMLTNQLRLAMIALETAAGPVGWGLAGLGLAVTAFSYADFLTYDSRG